MNGAGETFDLTRAGAVALDGADELAPFRGRFVIAEPELLYLDGNSLGRLPGATVPRLRDVVEREWGERLIRTWNEGWYTLSRRLGEKLASLIGAGADEVIVADSTTVNLHKLTLAALAAQPGRSQIITDDLNFPSDMYVFQGTGAELTVVPSPDGVSGPEDGILEAIDEETALVSLSHVTYKSGYLYDLGPITRRAHEAGALVLWDLSHSVGAVPIDLGGHAVDLAVGCTYKYLNGGPGAPAFLYVRRDWQERLRNPIPGWFSQRRQFELGMDYDPSSGIGRFLTGTPPVLSLAAIEPGLDLMREAGLERLRAKSVRQTEYLIALWEAWLAPLGFRLNTPRQPDRRGSHVALGHPEAGRIDQALIEEMGVLPDFRRPDNLRLGVAPLYTRYVDLFEAMARLRRVMVEGVYARYPGELPAVT